MDGVIDQPLSELLRGTPYERFVAPLRQKKVAGAVDLLVRAAELGSVLGRDAEAVLLMAGRLYMPLMETPVSLPAVERLSWACPVLDPVFGGGLQMAGVTEFAGSAGSGKTQLAMWLAGRSLATHRDSGVIYICTEGEFPAKRFCQMRHEGLASAAALARVVVERAATFDELWSVASVRLPILIAKTRARLVVLDSVGALRSEFEEGDMGARTDHLWRLGQRLKWISDQYCCGVIVINQVRADMSDRAVVRGGGGEAVTAALGLVWSNCVNTRIMVSKHASSRTSDGSVERTMAVELCPYLPNFAVDFVVTSEGVQGLRGEGQ